MHWSVMMVRIGMLVSKHKVCDDTLTNPVSYTHLDVYKRQQWKHVCDREEDNMEARQ